jgi:hypothetical protein
MGEVKSPEDFNNIVIAKRNGQANYKPMYLKDVGFAEDGLEATTSGENPIDYALHFGRKPNKVPAVAMYDRSKMENHMDLQYRLLSPNALVGIVTIKDLKD